MKKKFVVITLILILSFSLINWSCSAYAKSAKIFSINNLIRLTDLDKTFAIDIKYGTTDNFTKRILYKTPISVININTAKKLIKANNTFKKYGYHIKIFDTYRPFSVQKLMWDLCTNKKYLADPKKGSNHNRGAAVDITLVDKNGVELLMPSSYDEFSNRAHINYKSPNKKAMANRELLSKIMLQNGFKRISTEWWHFDDVNYKKYPLQDIQLEAFIEKDGLNK